MKNRIYQRLTLVLAAALLSGCAVLPFIPFLPIAGSAYEGFVVWNSGKAMKYYPFDLDTTYQAVMQASERLKLEVTSIKSAPTEGYFLKTKGHVPMKIETSPLDKSVSVSKVAIRISIFGDKQFVELFYRMIDENLPKKAFMAREDRRRLSGHEGWNPSTSADPR